jgi:hypothetical protein
MTARRVRIVRFVVSIEAVVDDGDNLTPLPVQPVPYAAADASLFNVDHIRDALQRQVDAAELPVEQPAS